MIILVSFCARPARADYDVIVNSNDLLTEPQYDLVGAHTFAFDSAYAIIRGIESEITDEWETQIVRVDHFATNPTTTVLVTNAQWKAFTGGDEADTILPGNRMRVIGDSLQFLDQTTDAVYQIHVSTGEIRVLASKGAIAAVTGDASVRLLGMSAFSPTGEMAFYEETTDTLLTVDQEGIVSILLTESNFVALYGRTMTNYISGGMTYDESGTLYWTDTHSGSSGNGSIWCLTPGMVALEVLSESTIKDNTESYYPQVAFNDLIATADGLLYFYDRRDDFDAIVAFDPNGAEVFPGQRLVTLIDKQGLIDGPAGEDNVNSFGMYNGYLTWNMIGRGGTDIYGIPLLYEAEPSHCLGVWHYGFGMAGDLDQSCQVDFKDFAVLALWWLGCDGMADCGGQWLAGIDLRMDISMDAKINMGDMMTIAQQWLMCNEPDGTSGD